MQPNGRWPSPTAADFVAVRAYSHAFLAALDLIDRDFASAEQHCRECLSIATEFGLHSLAGQQYAQLALAAIAQGDIDDGRRQLAAAFDALHEDQDLLDVAFLLGHAAVLAAAEGRVADATRARAVSDALMARLGLVHWHMYEGARVAALGTGPDAGSPQTHTPTLATQTPGTCSTRP